ncbi:hypothetical protein [Pseudomonas mangrovi]|uniref:DUF3298 domain-containing protein n=1 Tax=Pseudomonas mangrovi TaxID=2161748 RepID=A0A2T5P9J3_9PSED|nr:hypothetical protein [Pseudomonas mangrovi]PTU74410.1 hypothetical protein DBO85_09960 [Pseudomonas mangrovi]
MLCAIRRALLPLVLLSSPLLHAAGNIQVLEGVLGKMPIVVELHLESERVEGRYFYRKHLLDLPLEGTVTAGGMQLQEGYERFGEPLPQLALTPTEEGGWKGQWRSPQGRVFAVQLAPVRLEALPAGADAFWVDLYQRQPYEFIRLLASGERQTLRESEFMGRRLQWRRDEVSGIELFELLDGYSPAQLERINLQLRERFWQEVMAFHQCQLGGSGMGSEFDQHATPHLFSAKAVSLSLFTSYFCGGAHPDFGDVPLTIEVDSGNELTLEEVLWIGDGKPFRYDYRDDSAAPERNDTDFSNYSRYRREQLAPWLVEQLTRLYPEQMQPVATDDDCDYSDTEIWKYPSWYLSDQGLHLGPSFARVARACEYPEWSVLPYEVIRQQPGRVKL